ncbi:MAG: hypothetical protein K2M48_00685, partial [Clostridiales bacterium]|nr:hypothetical protein [Clostridiales bacterium]
RIAKLFHLPISYFSYGGEQQHETHTAASASATAPTPSPAVPADIIGMCVQCGKVVRDGEAAETEPKLICNACAELNRTAEQRRIDEELKKKEDEAQRAKARINYEKASLRKRRNLALLIAIIPAAVVFVIFLVLSLLPENASLFGLLFGAAWVLAVLAYTFTAQMIWDGTVREVCLGGGHIISLPGVIFSLSPDGLFFLIAAKIFLAFVAAIVFVGSIIFCIFAAIVISPVTFVPSLLWHNREIRKVG